jgi:hypothetical protein
LESQIREWIVRYLAEEVSLDDLQGWLLPSTFDLDERSDPASADLAFSTQLLLAERARDHLSQSALDEHLRRLAGMASLGPPVHRATATAASTQQAPLTLQVAAAGRSRAAVSA